MLPTGDTTIPSIFALATAPGRAGVAVLRLSGPGARLAIEKITGPLPTPRQAAFRAFRHPASGETIDRGLVLWFPAPASFTGEDIAEFHLHGGRAILSALTEILTSLPNFRPAEPGEFTRRGFENGKFDLTEAEAVADLVDAETEAQLRLALRQLDGELGRLYDGWRDRLTRILAHSEAAIDFSDEDLPVDLAETQHAKIQTLIEEISSHLDDNHRGERLREGLSIAILGPPNAGKSSLLNALARRDAAIVSAIAGTTRDIIEIQLDLGGYPVTLADTAGLRDSADAIESEGITRALKRAEHADLKLLLFDGASWPHCDAATQNLIDANALLVVSKVDLLEKTEVGIRAVGFGDQPADKGKHFPPPRGEGQGEGHADGSPSGLSTLPSASSLESRPPNPDPQIPLFISTTTGQGLPELSQALTEAIAARFHVPSQPILTRARHRAALEECRAALTRAMTAPALELAAEDIRLATRALGRITGRIDVEDLLDVIFKDFCIGK